jgi:hypothetical protein
MRRADETHKLPSMASDRFRQDEAQFRAAQPGGVDLREWLLSLPFVVEVDPDMDSVALLAVDCPLLDRRRIWAATGLGYPDPRRGLSLVLPIERAVNWCMSGWSTPVLQLQSEHMLIDVDLIKFDGPGLERLALAAYADAFRHAARDSGAFE